MPDFDVPGAITSAAVKYGVDPDLALAIGHQESRLNPYPHDSSAGAVGPMQLMGPTASDLGVSDIRDPAQNIDGGVRYIRQIQDQFGADHPDLIAAGYNAGPHAVVKFGGVPPFAETRDYVAKVTGRLADAGPPTDELNKAFGVAGASTAPSAAPSPGAGPNAAPEVDSPPTDDLNHAFGVQAGAPPAAPGSFTINYDPKLGKYAAGGVAYDRDTQDPTLFTDPHGNKYQVQGVPEAPGQAPSPLTEVGAGAVEGPASLLNLNVVNPVYTALSGINTAFPGTVPQGLVDAYDAQKQAENVFGGITGFNPQNIPATTVPERLERAAGSGLAALAFPEEAGPSIGGAVRNALTGVIGATAGQGASELAPAPFKPVVSSLAALVAGGATHFGGKAIGGAVSGAQSALAPFAAAVSPDAVLDQAAGRIAASTTDIPAAKAALAQPPELVPGSPQTSFQVTGDLGHGMLEKGARNVNEAPFTAIKQAQNDARLASLGAIQSGADPASVGQAAADHLARIDAETQSAVEAATQAAEGQRAQVDQSTQAGVDQARGAAQASAQGLGGDSPPEQHGADLRAAIVDAESAARQREGALHEAIDPNKDLTGNAVASKSGISQIVADHRPTASPLSAAEQQIYAAAASMPDVAPVADIVALKQNIRAAMSSELATNGRTPVYARLSQAMKAVQSNLSTTISDKVASDEAQVQSGALPASQSAATRLQQALDEANRQGLAVSFGGGGGRASGKLPGARPSPVANLSGGGLQGGGQSGDAAGGAPVQGSGAGGEVAQPTFDQAGRARVAVANQSSRERAGTFGVRPVSNVTQTTGMAGQYRLPDGSVPGQFFKTGPAGFDAMTRAVKAGGDKALGVLQDFAAGSLRRAAQNADGTIDPAKFARWKTSHQDALRALPAETQARFADAASAGQAVADAAAARTEAVRAANTSALAKVADATAARKTALSDFKSTPLAKLSGLENPSDVTRAVGTMLRSKNAAQTMGDLAASVADNPAAKAGLRQAIADHIANALVSNTEAGTSGHELIKADQFQSFVKNNREALGKVLGPDDMDRLDRIAADIQRSKRSDNALTAAGSDTMLNKSAVEKFTQVVGRHARGPMDILGTILGEHLGGPGVGAMTGIATDLLQQMRAHGISRVTDMVNQAILHPEVMKKLLARVPDDPKAQKSLVEGLGRALATSVIGASVNHGKGPQARVIHIAPKSVLQGVAA